MNELEKSYKHIADLRQNYLEKGGELPDEWKSFLDVLEAEIVSVGGKLEIVAEYFSVVMRFFLLFLEFTPYQTRQVREAREVLAQFMEHLTNKKTKH